ncbi:MAG: hypothetical protein Q8R76_09135 [Candidatus Omnitrophota bacterium]|nr:hypothetical protein [Candidatus Omnitrophota bacterium]
MGKAKSSRPPLRRWAVPTLLVLVAATQMVLTQTSPLSPWRGGGFGMFGTVDSVGARFLSLEGETANGKRVPINIDATLRRIFPNRYDALRSRPTEKALRLLGEDLLLSDYIPSGPPSLGLYLDKVAKNPVSRAVEDRLFEDFYMMRRNLDTDFYIPKTKMKALQMQVWSVDFSASDVTLTCRPVSLPLEVHAS